MQTLTLDSGHKIRYFAFLDEFPAERRSHLTRYLLEMSELDMTPDAFTDRIGRILQWVGEGNTEFVTTALQNLLFSFHAVRIGYAPDELAFGVLVSDINGVPVTDLSPEGLLERIRPLQIPVGQLNEIIEEVKKNFRTNGPDYSRVSLGLLA